MASFKFSLELQKKLIDLLGSDKYQECVKLIKDHGCIVCENPNISIKLPSIEISASDIAARGMSPMRRFQFSCKLGGEEIKGLKKIELDPFNFDDGDLFEARLTIIPLMEENPNEGHRTS